MEMVRQSSGSWQIRRARVSQCWADREEGRDDTRTDPHSQATCLVYGSVSITRKSVRISSSDRYCCTDGHLWEFRYRAGIVCDGFGVRRPMVRPYFIVLLASHSTSLIHRNLINKMEIVSMPVDSWENFVICMRRASVYCCYHRCCFSAWL